MSRVSVFWFLAESIQLSYFRFPSIMLICVFNLINESERDFQRLAITI